MLRTRNPRATRRRAVILMVVLVLLTLFAIVGITFVFYAQKSHTASLNFREAWQIPFQNTGGNNGGGTVPPPNISPDVLLGWGLRQIIYDVADNGEGLQSAARGHSLSRAVYGYNDAVLNIQPFNGTGRLHYPHQEPNAGVISNVDDYTLVNYIYFANDGFLRDPERLGVRGNVVNTADLTQRGLFTGGHNPNYTYPDLNNFHLAASRADGTQLTPSFHRHWLFNQGKAFNDITNPNWTNAQGKYLLARYRPADMGPGFPYPSDAYGDVKNKIGAPGGNDSVWIDMGHPVVTGADGRKFKPMFAWLVEDLDGLVNVNAHGNLMGPIPAAPGGGGVPFTHASNQGWGKWEVNLARVLNSTSNPDEWKQIFVGSTQSNPPVVGRYGTDGVPRNGAYSAPGGKLPRLFAQVDYNGWNETTKTPSPPPTLPTDLIPFPRFLAEAYENNFTNQAKKNHARLFDYFQPAGQPFAAGQPAPWDDRVLPVADMRKFLFQGATGSSPMNSDLGRLCPDNFRDTDTAGQPLKEPERSQNIRRRRLITTLSMDLGRMGLAPWLYDRQTSGYAPNADPTLPPSGPATASASLAQRQNPVPDNSDFRIPGQPSTNLQADWRSNDAALEKVNLSQILPPYPHQDPNTFLNPPIPGIQPYYARFDDGGNVQSLSNTAQKARQEMATQIYRRLLVVTGAAYPDDWNAQTGVNDPGRLAVLRWLGQLAVNIVDYIDEDEISTPFNFYAAAYTHFTGQPPRQIWYDEDSGKNGAQERILKYWVFGTELPTVVLNEVYTEYQEPADPNNAQNKGVGPFQVKVWAELFSPIPTYLSQGTQSQDGKAIPLHIPVAAAGQAAYSPYRVVIANTADPNGPLFPQSDNVLGAPDQVRTGLGAQETLVPPPNSLVGGTTFDSPRTKSVGIPNPNAALMAVDPSDTSYFILGPPGNTVGNTINAQRGQASTPWYESTNMQYQVQRDNAGNWVDGAGQVLDDRPKGITVLLRRLANPHLPEDTRTLVPDGMGGQVLNPNFNPYVTVDYMERVPLKDVFGPLPKNTSRGKKQPYAADLTQVADQVFIQNGMPADIQHTLSNPNASQPQLAKADWLAHLDRQVTSPLELLCVSGFRPHELTHRFITAGGTQQHRVPWFDEDIPPPPMGQPPSSHRLYRLFAFLEAQDQASGVSLRGRIPGKININTIWEPEILLALCDPQGSNYYTSTDVYNPANPGADLWSRLLQTRTPNMQAGGPLTITDQDRPFLDPAGLGHLPVGDQQAPLPLQGRGLDDTLFRLRNTAPPAAANHPYFQNELLTRIYSHFTTRSNVFAVWLTVGFFEVTDDTTIPPKLGAEIGRANGTEIRYRFFAIVDRTEVVVAPQLVNSSTAVVGASVENPIQVTITPVDVASMPTLSGTITYSGSNTVVPWQITKGSILLIDRGTEWEETVVVEEAGMDQMNVPYFKATFIRPHQAGFSITMNGNPGPQPQFDPNLPRYRPVVPYWEQL
jgi:hypothetical protein